MIDPFLVYGFIHFPNEKVKINGPKKTNFSSGFCQKKTFGPSVFNVKGILIFFIV